MIVKEASVIYVMLSSSEFLTELSSRVKKNY